MEWIFIGGLLVYLLVLLRFFPELFAPRCPFCGARLERRFDSAIVSFGKHWHLGLRKFMCPQCFYSHRRPVIYRDPEVTKHEASSVR
jgi:hypothetical protein